VNRLRAIAGGLRARPGVVAIACLGIAWGLTMHSLGWAQLAHFAQVRAFADGTAEIDRYHWQTNDKGWVDGHYYSVKSPGVAALSLPAYLALDAAGGWSLAHDATANARGAKHARWAPRSRPPLQNYGYSRDRAVATEQRIEQSAPMIWALTLLVAVIPAVALLLGVRWAAERLGPGYGTAAALTLGAATILMSFASEYFSHVIAAALGFGAFLLLMRERAGPPRLGIVAAAGALAGLAVSFEYQVGLVGMALLAYALARSAPRLPRAAAYGAAALAGALPALAFNWWALGSPFEFAYGSAVSESGFSGHDEIGLNDDGFFGIAAPRLDGAVELLLGNRGLLVLTPVVAMAVAGLAAMRGRGHRAEAHAIGAIAAVYFFYNAGYWLVFGGGSPGPRFLIPALPFLAIGFAFAYRRWPATTLALAIPSALFMGVAAISFPLLGEQGPGIWAEYVLDDRLEHTVATALGVTSAWPAIAPVIAAWVAAIAFALRATPIAPLTDLRMAAAAVLAWAAVAAIGPSLAGSETTPLGDDREALYMVALFAGLSLLAVGAMALRQRDAQASGTPASVRAEAALGKRSS